MKPLLRCTPTAADSLLIGQVAATTGVPIKTIRFYEDQGLITSAGRTEGGYRLFAPEVCLRLAFIKRAQGLGMSLQEIGDFLHIRDQGSLPCDAIHARLEAHILTIDTRIAELLALKQQLTDLLSNWHEPAQSSNDPTICPNLQA